MQLLRNLFDSYVLIHPTIYPRDPFTTRYINENFKNAVADAYEAPPQFLDLQGLKQLPRAAFDRYVLIRPTIRFYDPFPTLHTDNKQQNAVADTYGALPDEEFFHSYPSLRFTVDHCVALEHTIPGAATAATRTQNDVETPIRDYPSRR